MKIKKPEPGKSSIESKTLRNPLYQKIGKRIRQARLMARESNSRDLSIRLGWSGGRIHNYESGLSTPGVDETLQFCQAVGVDPSWITYGVGAPRPVELHSMRYRKFIDTLDQAEKQGNLEEYLAAVKLPIERMRKFRNNPYSKIPDVMARRCEKYLGQRRGWIDKATVSPQTHPNLSDDIQDLLLLFAKLSPRAKKQFYDIGELLLS
jgi:transcriptional regulator with XRE-family HTH domain